MNTNVVDYGAVADGVTLNTSMIQRAIDTCAANGGGRVTVPGGTYKTGTLWLRSNVELHLEIGAVLLASENMDDYNALDAYEQNYGYAPEGWVGKHLIIAHEINNCAITGFGMINGNCQAFVDMKPNDGDKVYGWCHGTSVLKDPEQMRPGQLICFIESTNVRVQDISIRNSPCWSCFLLGCEYVQIRGIKINNPIWMMNSDGIDIDASRYVTVSDCIIQTGDDAITLRGCENRVKNKDIHCEFISISNCVLATGICAFRIGVGTGLVRHARISNITISQCMNIAQFCTAYGKKGKVDIEDVNFSNISAENTDRCFQAFAFNGAFIKNITMENIRTTSTVRNYVECEDGAVEGFRVRNVEIRFFDRSTVLPESQRQFRGDRLLSFADAQGVVLDGVEIYGTLDGVQEPVEIVNCDDLIKRNCNF